jgi:hypothetical protein
MSASTSNIVRTRGFGRVAHDDCIRIVRHAHAIAFVRIAGHDFHARDGARTEEIEDAGPVVRRLVVKRDHAPILSTQWWPSLGQPTLSAVPTYSTVTLFARLRG